MTAPLSTLTPGQSGTVCGFVAIDSAAERLMQMGVIEGVEVEVLRHAPAGDPIEIRVMGYALSLRNAEAANVLIDPIEIS
jgi:ferrous iron transport protein A